MIKPLQEKRKQMRFIFSHFGNKVMPIKRYTVFSIEMEPKKSANYEDQKVDQREVLIYYLFYVCTLYRNNVFSLILL